MFCDNISQATKQKAQQPALASLKFFSLTQTQAEKQKT